MRPKQPDPVPEMKRAVAGALVDKLQGWTQEKAAALLRTSQPRVSNLRNNKLHRFSLEQLIRMATRVNGYAYVEIGSARISWDRAQPREPQQANRRTSSA